MLFHAVLLQGDYSTWGFLGQNVFLRLWQDFDVLGFTNLQCVCSFVIQSSY